MKIIRLTAVLLLVMTLVLSVCALAEDLFIKKIEVASGNIKIIMNGQQMTLKDANGNIVEPFIYEGTTYVPVRAISEAYDKIVSWDGENSTVIINDKRNDSMPDSSAFEAFVRSVTLNDDAKDNPPLPFERLSLVKKGTEIQEIHNLLGPPHGYIGSGIVKDVYDMEDGNKLVVDYGMHRAFVEYAFVFTKNGESNMLVE